MLETCGLLTSLGYSVPKPDLIHPLKHRQELWVVKRSLSQSACPGPSTETVEDGRVGKIMISFLCMKNSTEHVGYNAKGFPSWSSGKESTFQCRGRGFDPWSGN
ncbi:uncharacterized protein LOC132480641 isoform X2 [Mesoplodon densirostris]|uniref:uncharacterized protein LOC132480641 isoform X2 n=1 Tax=Mesoplodon densirostris TaxID=48708 RepID=UPI0028DBD461|nr:uncharacterized protein LOC132480641 isoform X2 [Mesoplodon densirostris]